MAKSKYFRIFLSGYLKVFVYAEPIPTRILLNVKIFYIPGVFERISQNIIPKVQACI